MTGHFFLLICINHNVMIKNIQIILGMSSVNEKYSVIPASLLKRAVCKTPITTMRLCIFRNYNKILVI